MRYRRRVLLLLALSLLFNKYCTAEEINISTYYPSPYGSYKNLRLYPGAPSTCDANNEGLMYYDNTENTVKICRQTGSLPDTYDWESETYWVKSGNDIYNTNSGNVGIGTSGPGSKLTIQGLNTIYGLDWDAWPTTSALNVTDSRGTSLLRVNDSGYVGIGKANPNQVLHLARIPGQLAGPWIYLENDLQVWSGIGFYGSGPTGGLLGQVLADNSAAKEIVIRAHVDSNALRFDTNGENARMYITKTGLVGIGTTNPNAATLLDVSSTTKGFLPPRMTTAQRTAISSPPAGLMIYNTDDNELNFYDGSVWKRVAGS